MVLWAQPLTVDDEPISYLPINNVSVIPLATIRPTTQPRRPYQAADAISRRGRAPARSFIVMYSPFWVWIVAPVVIPMSCKTSVRCSVVSPPEVARSQPQEKTIHKGVPWAAAEAQRMTRVNRPPATSAGTDRQIERSAEMEQGRAGT